MSPTTPTCSCCASRCGWSGERLVGVVGCLADFARRHRDLPCLAYTHLQPAQPTTVGKRACLWAYDLVLDLIEIEHRLEQLKAQGSKGTTGTQASFLSLFNGDHGKVRRLEELVCEKMGFAQHYPVTGQTYSRKVDSQVMAALSGIAQRHKMATDLRLLAHRKEIEEPFEAEQVGSSAMAYKRNPMRCERICSLARFVAGQESAVAQTAAVQWLERTLDDSAVRRLALPQAFLAIDAVLILCRNVTGGLVVYPRVIGRRWRPSCLSWQRRTSLWRPLPPAATGRTCTSASAVTVRPPPRWSRSKGGRTTCWTAWPPTRHLPKSI